MKILVIDDKGIHRESAIETLSGHDVTLAKSFDEAMNLICPKGIRSKWGKNEVMSFDVVLTDMNLPASRCRGTLALSVFNLQEECPLGFIIALKAALCGAKYVAMITDANHHDGVMTAALDSIGCAYYGDGFKPNFTINGAHVMFVHAPFQEDLGKEDRKDWGKVLRDLLKVGDAK